MVNSAVCECNRITWDPPAAQTLTTTVKLIPSPIITVSHATMNAASMTAVPQTRKCGNTCSTLTQIKAVVQTGSTMPAWMSLDQTTGRLTVSPNDNNQIGPYKMTVTMTTPDSGDQTYETIFITVQICVITGMVDPVIPNLAGLSQLVYATSPLVIDVSSPGFVQTPACGYGLINTFTWTIPSGAPITQDTANPKNWYKLTVTTRDPK